MNRFSDGLNLLLVLAMAGFSLWAWPRLPDWMPVHFGLDGRPDGWAERSPDSSFPLPAVATLLTLRMSAFRILPRRSPRLVNLPDRIRLSDLPEVARGRVLERGREAGRRAAGEGPRGGGERE